jgi:hypothetical protein
MLKRSLTFSSSATNWASSWCPGCDPDGPLAEVQVCVYKDSLESSDSSGD